MHEQDEADGSDGEAAVDTGSHDMDDADDDTFDGAEGGEAGESNPDDSDADDDIRDNNGANDADDGWDDDDDGYGDDGDQDDRPDDEPAQPLPPMWATEVVTSSTAKPEQIGDVVKYLASGDRSKVGRLIVNFGRREFFIKPIGPDERVMRLDSGNVARICDGGLVDFDSDEYEQRLKDLIKTMIGGRRQEEPAKTATENGEKAPEKEEKTSEDDDKDASAPSTPSDETVEKADSDDENVDSDDEKGEKPDSGDTTLDDENDDGDAVFNSILEDIDVDGLNWLGDMDELFDGRDAEAGSDVPDTEIDVTPEDIDDMF